MKDTTSEDIDRWIAELKAAGWKPKSPTIWQAPDGKLWLGPHGAWKKMRQGATRTTEEIRELVDAAWEAGYAARSRHQSSPLGTRIHAKPIEKAADLAKLLETDAGDAPEQSGKLRDEHQAKDHDDNHGDDTLNLGRHFEDGHQAANRPDNQAEQQDEHK